MDPLTSFPSSCGKTDPPCELQTPRTPHSYCYSSSPSPPLSARLRFAPAGALGLGPQFGVGFGWYRTSLTFHPGNGDSGCFVKSHSCLITQPVSERVPRGNVYALGRFDKQRARRRALRDLRELDGVRLYPRSHEVVHFLARCRCLQRASERVRARDLVVSVEQRGPAPVLASPTARFRTERERRTLSLRGSGTSRESGST
jgi:hypothetical protein